VSGGLKMTVEEDGVKKLKLAMGNLEMGTKFFEVVGAIVGGDIIGNINAGQQADGSAIKTNAPSTLAKKQRQGNSPIRSLVDVERRFIRKGKSSWIWRATKKGVTIEPSTLVDELVASVQAKGYLGWFGISRRGQKAIAELLRIRIIRILKKVT